MKKVKIVIETVVKDNNVIENLKDCISSALDENAMSYWCSSIKVHISQNTKNRKGKFKAGQVYKILDVDDNKNKYLLLVSTGSLYIKGIILTDKLLEEINYYDDGTFFKNLSKSSNGCIYYYTYFENEICCPYNHYCSITNKAITSSMMQSNDYIPLKLEYIQSIEDKKLACIIGGA